MTAVKVLISDKMSDRAAEILRQRGVDVDFLPGMSAEELQEKIANYDGLAVRSSTTVTPEVIAAAKNLKVIGRAGIGVDNIDQKAATDAGIVVMNTPFGNAITTAEHTVAMMFAVSRHIPQANASTHAGKWEKSKFMGQELYAKTLGIIGCGNIGRIVASRALGLQMKVVVYDPYLADAQAAELGVEKLDLDALAARADYITLHTPLTEKTRGLVNAEFLGKTKKGVFIINCARGALVAEQDLLDALNSGHVAGAALDVFVEEPAHENILFGHGRVICTPHLGASTLEAQENVAVQVAEQIADFLLAGAVQNALNMPSVSAEDAPKLKPYMKLSEQLGGLIGQITQSPIKSVRLTYEGAVSRLNVKPLSCMTLAGLLRPVLDGVNMVNAPARAAERGIKISETFKEGGNGFHTLIKIEVDTENSTHSASGTLFGESNPRIVNIEGVPIEAGVAPHMLFIRNEDKPGLIGALGSLLGDAGINIADFRLGRIEGKDQAVALVAVDEPLTPEVIKKITELPQIARAHALSF
ncbi:MAG: phosphoglycerate dehydrogenase [Micavibrio sp.]|nr:MAG: phosphoglycerate dehydrogenase [Micavibrio sp.]